MAIVNVDISPLSTLTNLTELSLHGDGISDITPLSTMINKKAPAAKSVRGPFY